MHLFTQALHYGWKKIFSLSKIRLPISLKFLPHLVLRNPYFLLTNYLLLSCFPIAVTKRCVIFCQIYFYNFKDVTICKHLSTLFFLLLINQSSTIFISQSCV